MTSVKGYFVQKNPLHVSATGVEKGLQVNLEQNWQLQQCFHTERS
jgi:hypothetical protein